MKNALSWMILLVVSFTAKADNIYSSVKEYVNHVTNNSIEKYECNISSNYPSYEGCSLGSLFNPKVPIIFGVLKSTTDSIGFIFVLEVTADGKLKLIEQSKPVKFNNDILGVDELELDSNIKFHIKFNFGRMGTPSSFLYRFSQIKNKWRVTGIDFSELAYCADIDNSIGYSKEISTNFLTGNAVINEYKNCNLSGIKKTRKTHPVYLLSDFVPLDKKYILVH